MVAPTQCKDYGILSVVFQQYRVSIKCHFTMPPSVFYPQPSKVDSFGADRLLLFGSGGGTAEAIGRRATRRFAAQDDGYYSSGAI